MSDVQQDGIRASRARPYGRDVDARPSHRAVPVTAQRQKLARAGTMILLVLALAMLCGLIGAAMALLVHPLRQRRDRLRILSLGRHLAGDDERENQASER